MPANITMPFEEFDAMRKQLDQMGEQIRSLQAKLTEEKLDGGDPETTRAMAITVRAALKIVSFATANLSPEVIKGWPYDALRTIAGKLKLLPDYSILDDEYGFELEKIAVECEVWEQRRKRDGEQYVPPPAPNPPPSLQELMQAPNPIKQSEEVKRIELERTFTETQS